MSLDGTVTWRELWNEAAARVGNRAQARWLCETASGLESQELLLELESRATQRAVAHLDRMLARLANGEPLQYVLGHWSFRHLDLMVDRRVLIPRPETEEVAGLAIELAAAPGRPVRCADLGTGSGAIGLALAAELATRRPPVPAEVWLTDVDGESLDVARANLAGIGRGAATVRFAAGSWFGALPGDLRGGLDVVVCNPPYVADDDPQVEAVVRAWEPAGALFAGEDGLDAIREIVAEAPGWLAPGGWLVLEIGADQGAAVAALADAAGLADVEIRPDAAGRDRMLVARS
ncbi:MAG: peptide chain release factor N(5)-glutamine methyltransferase [Ilumatobacteraceae bacterium]